MAGRSESVARGAEPREPQEPREPLSALGQYVRRWCAEHGLTVTDLADMAELSPGLLSQYLRGQLRPKRANRLKLARALGLDLATLDALIDEGRLPPSPPAEASAEDAAEEPPAAEIVRVGAHRFVVRLRRLPPERQEELARQWVRVGEALLESVTGSGGHGREPARAGG